MCGGSGGPSGETKYNWNDSMDPRWNTALNSAEWNSQVPFQQYTGQRYAGLAPDQTQAATYIRDLSRTTGSPVQAMDAARNQISDTISGKYLSGNSSDPYANLMNPVNNQNTSTDRNLFAGNNPYFQDALMSGLNDIGDIYKNVTAPDTNAAAVLNGTLGGGDHERLMEKNQGALAKGLGNFTDQMLNKQYDRSAGLEDSFLNRDIQNQQFTKSGAQSAWEAMAGRGSGAFQNERNRQMGAIPLGQAENGLALQRAGAMNQFGQQQQQANQQPLDFAYQQWTAQQNHPYQMLDWLTGLYSRAQGGMSPNQQIYQSGASQAAPWLGAAIAGASMWPSP